MSRSRSQHHALTAAIGLLLGGTACIIPDRGIRVESDDDNPGAVRIVEAIALPESIVAPCREPEQAEPEQLARCPQVPSSPIRRGLIPGGPYCSCPGRDGNAAPEFSVYAEDPDRISDEPADTLYAVALRDLDPVTLSPQNYVAYTEHLNPGGAGEHVPALGSSVGREDNGLWRFRIGKDMGVGIDLCNDDDGETLEPGLHALQIMVTDRPFFQPVRVDDNGEPLTDAAGRPLLAPPQYGMPDLGIGATWSVANYVFLCEDPAVQMACNCIEEET